MIPISGFWEGHSLTRSQTPQVGWARQKLISREDFLIAPPISLGYTVVEQKRHSHCYARIFLEVDPVNLMFHISRYLMISPIIWSMWTYLTEETKPMRIHSGAGATSGKHEMKVDAVKVVESQKAQGTLDKLLTCHVVRQHGRHLVSFEVPATHSDQSLQTGRA